MTFIKNLSKHAGEEVTLKGWLYNKRSSGKVKFLIMRDGTALAQCIVFKGNVTDEVFTLDRKSTRLNSSHTDISRMPSSA